MCIYGWGLSIPFKATTADMTPFRNLHMNQ